MAGQQPQTQVHQAPGGQASPGYGWAKGFFSGLPGMANNPYPTYQGQLDPGLSPTMQNAIRMSQGYSQAGPSEILQGAQGSLGRFMTPSFSDPRMRLPMGSPDLFGANPNQRMYGGGRLGQLGQGFSSMGGGGLQGQMNQRQPQFGGPNQIGGGRMPLGGGPSQPYGGGMQSMNGGGLQGGDQVAYAGGSPNFDEMSGINQIGRQRMPIGGMQNTNGGGLFGAPPGMQSFTGPGVRADGMQSTTGGGIQADSPQQSYAGQAPGAQTAWDMGNLRNFGQVQNGQIWTGGGQGGDSGQWQTFDPNNWGHQQASQKFNRYGSNWSSGAGAGGTGAHSSEMKPWLQNWLGRDPSQQEQDDLYYGLNPDMQKIKQSFAAQSAAYDPSSASYDPNARYNSPAYRGKGRPASPGGVGQVRQPGQEPNLAALLSGLQKRG